MPSFAMYINPVLNYVCQKLLSLHGSCLISKFMDSKKINGNKFGTLIGAVFTT